MRIFRNMTLKFLALIFAMVLWFHVATNQRYDLEILYQITYVNIPEALAIASPPVGEVPVMVRGSGKALMRLMWGERRWPIDLSRAKPGRQQIRIQAENVPLYGIQGLEVLGLLELDTLTIILDSVVQKTVPVRSGVEITPSEGFICAASPVLTPDSVLLTGPRLSLKQINQISTQPEIIDDVRNPVERQLGLLPCGYGVSSDVDQINFYQKIEPFLTRSFAAVPVLIRGRHTTDNLSVSPDRIQVEVAGPQSAVTRLDMDSISATCEPLFLAGARVSALAMVMVPAPLRVLKVSPDSVTVERRERSQADSGD